MIVSPKKEETINTHINNIRALQTSKGLFLASIRDSETGYDKAWLRDNFYTALAFEYIGDMETVRAVWKSIIDIFLKHEEKISWATGSRPLESWQYIHARYDPETFDEYWEEWGNKQNDAVGSILFKLGDLEEKGQNIIETEDEKRIVQKLVNYLAAIEYWHDPDNGMWEEYEELHASSLGACVAGLKKVAQLPYIVVQDEIIKKGEEALVKLLPRESETKFVDLALLSLVYPYRIVSDEMASEILTNVEYHLERRRGVIRYKNDHYYNKNSDGHSEEAEWTMGFPWLAIIYARMGDITRAENYLNKSGLILTPEEKIPELYYSNTATANENIPLGWAESLYVAALVEIENARTTQH
ncbi:MAG: glycoside hydrolase family 15 [Candidatus Pacebacteria bacterium]|nr:glycoside hydrolase family 15 [Candidatus Paceibacterota bacterium]